jgi:two-component system, chemotaxis family, protein-glutamate methylesterase/glutaminase
MSAAAAALSRAPAAERQIRGAADIVAAGGGVIAQDEAASLVWGMTRSVARAGLCSAALPLDEISAKVLRLFSGVRS